MKKGWGRFLVGLAMVVMMGSLVLGGSGQAVADKTAGVDKATKTRIQETYGKLPLYFIQNNGQVDKRVSFYEKGSGHTTFFTQEGVYLLLTKPQESAAKIESKEGNIKHLEYSQKAKEFQMIKLLPLNANKNPEIIAEGLQQGKVNYFIGNDKSKWRANIPTYQAVMYKEVYPGIDIRFYGNNRQLEYDIIVKPGADPQQVGFSYEGIEGLKVTKKGDLKIILKQGNLIQQKPIIYQEIAGKRVEVEGAFKVNDKEADSKHFAYSFELASYNKNHPLIIDPVLVYSTYLGGSNYDFGYGIAVDSAGAAYVTGWASSSDFPTTAGAYQGSLAGGDDAFVTKLDAAGASLSYSTYLGGTRQDYVRDITVDSAGAAYVTGRTNSSDFPTTAGAYQGSLAGHENAFVAKLDPAGSSLSYSTYLGGNSYDFGHGIAVDSAGAAYITGWAQSRDFPTTADAYQGSSAGHTDAFVTKLDAAGSSLTYSSYLGGSDGDIGWGIAVDSAGNAYITGETSSSDFPTQNPIQGSLAGASDAFVTKLDASGSSLSYSSYLGGSDLDEGGGIAVDTAGNAYVTGYTASSDFPTQNPFQGAIAGYDDAFVTKLDASGSSLSYSTYLGGSDGDGGSGIAVDTAGNAYVTGSTKSSDFPTQNPIQGSLAGARDAFVTKLDAAGSSLTYSSYLGGSDGDNGSGIAVDSAGNAYITGSTSSDFPTTPGAYQGSSAGYTDAFVAKIGEEPTPAGKISGCVMADGGYTPVVGARVNLFQGPTLVDFTFTDASAHYKFLSVEDGIYRVMAGKPGYGRDIKVGRVQQATPWGKEEFINLMLIP